MRIALVSMHTSPAAVPGSGDAGGMNVVVSEAARALAGRGHEVVVVTRASSAIAPGEYALGAAGGAVPGGAGPGNAHDDPALIALPAGALGLGKGELPTVLPEFAAGLRDLGPFDAVHAHYWLSGIAARHATADRGTRVAMTFHTLAGQKNARLAPGDAPEPEARVAAERSLTAGCFVVAGSRSELGGVEEFAGTPGLGSAVVHPGVDTGLFRPRRLRQAAGAGDPLRVTVLGRVQPLKGQDLALRAAGTLARTDPGLFARTEWVIAGEPTPGAEDYAAGLRELAERLGIAPSVRFLPAQSRRQAAALLASSALVLVPSHSETFGLTALEAAACGVPVIASAHTGLLEAVPHGIAGELLPDREPGTWAAAIAALLGDDRRRARLGASARTHAEAHDWGAHAEALERIYEGLA